MNDTEIISLFWARSESAITELGKKYDRLAPGAPGFLHRNPALKLYRHRSAARQLE